MHLKNFWKKNWKKTKPWKKNSFFSTIKNIVWKKTVFFSNTTQEEQKRKRLEKQETVKQK